MKGQDVGVELVVVIAANPKSYADPFRARRSKSMWNSISKPSIGCGRRPAPEGKQRKGLRLVHRMEREIRRQDECDELEPYLTENRHYTLADNYKFFTTKVKGSDGKEMTMNESFQLRTPSVLHQAGTTSPKTRRNS
jgi:hypothetical protein